jgi:dTDP-4-dehydrorhamnose 3,5-epimerase
MPCKITETELPGVMLVEPSVFEDSRGYFMELYNGSPDSHGKINTHFLQDNFSSSKRGVIRGLHYQYPSGQAKLVQVLKGEVYDVAVDIRRNSPTFKKWVGFTLSDRNHRQLFIPDGFAHGFAVLSENALFLYKCSAYYAPDHDRGIYYADPEIDIQWPIERPVLSQKDEALPLLMDIAPGHLPDYPCTE